MEIGRLFLQLVCLISMASTAAAVAAPGKCDHGYTYLPSTGNCYKIVYERHNWYSAGKKCEDLRSGTHLVAITSAEENREVKTFLAEEILRNEGNTACMFHGAAYGDLYWTSGQQLIKNNCQSPFVWRLSSDKLVAFDFTSWATGEPNCGTYGESCVGIWVYKDFHWNDFPCSDQLCPLCEYKP